MFQLLPPLLPRILRGYLPVVFAIIVALLAGCGGDQAVITEDQDVHPANTLVELGLPALGSLSEGGLRSISLSNNPDPSLAGDSYNSFGGNVSVSNPASAQIVALAEDMSYAIYQFTDLSPEDMLEAVTVNAAAVDSGEDFGYYLLYSDYKRKAWRTAARRQTPGERTFVFDTPGQAVSEIGTAYLAVVAYGGEAAKVVRVSAHFNFFGRLGIDHFESSLPETDAKDTQIRFSLQAVDDGGGTVAGFSQPVTLNSSLPGMTVVSQPIFQAGVAQAIVSFSSAGNYPLYLEDVGAPPSGMLGTIKVYESALPVYTIEIAEADLAKLDADPWSDEYYPAHITIEGQQFPGIRVRYRGGTTRDLPKKNWKVKLNKTFQYADPDWGYDNKTLNINAQYSDPTLMRDKLCYDVFQDMNVLAPRARFIHLRVNGAFFGVYTQVEQPRKDWLESFGVNPEGPLYEAKNSNLEELGSAANYLGPFDKELKELEPYDDLAGFITAFNNWPAGSFNSQFTATMDAGNYLNYMVANTLISQGDHMFKNYLLYQDRAGTARWFIVPWDNDLTWGRQWSEELELFDYTPHYGLPIDYGVFPDGGTWGNFLMDRWLNDPQFTVQYEAAIGDALANYFTEEEFIGRVDEAYNLILPDVMADPQRYTGGIDYEVWVEELREYVRQRRIRLADYIL